VIAGPSVSLHDYDVVYFGNDWFAENRTSSHHVAMRLAERTRVLYVDVPGLRAPKASGRDVRKLWTKMTRAAARPAQVGDRLWHMTMPQVPFRRLPFVSQANDGVGSALVRRAMAHLGFSRTMSWFAVPHPAALAGMLGEAFVVYYCIDDYAALPDVDVAATRCSWRRRGSCPPSAGRTRPRCTLRTASTWRCSTRSWIRTCRSRTARERSRTR
jgi:hypothetical protein